MTAQISFVIPVYNVKPYLVQCLESVIRTNVEKEIILIDDGSTDGSREILEEYQQKYPYITLVCQSNKGVSAARNIGIKLAKGEYLQFVDPDDYLLTDDYDWLIQQAKSSNSDVLRGLCIQYHNGIEIAKDIPRALPQNSIPDDTLALSNIKGDYFFTKLTAFPAVWLGFFRTALLRENQCLFDERLYVLEDLIFMFDVLCKNNVKVIEVLKPIYAYQVRVGSIINNTEKVCHIKRLLKGIDVLWDKYQYYQEIGHETLKNIVYHNMILNAYKVMYFHYSMVSGDEKENIKLLFTKDIRELFKHQLNIELG